MDYVVKAYVLCCINSKFVRINAFDTFYKFWGIYRMILLLSTAIQMFTEFNNSYVTYVIADSTSKTYFFLHNLFYETLLLL